MQHLLSFGITPKSETHRNSEVVTLDFKFDNDIIKIVKQNGGRWSKVLNKWYVPRKKICLEKS